MVQCMGIDEAMAGNLRNNLVVISRNHVLSISYFFFATVSNLTNILKLRYHYRLSKVHLLVFPRHILAVYEYRFLIISKTRCFISLILSPRMALAVRIHISAGQNSSTKILKFPPEISIQQVLKEIKEKTNVGGDDYGLYMNGVPEKRIKPKWLDRAKSLKNYFIKNNVSQSNVPYMILFSFVNSF